MNPYWTLVITAVVATPFAINNVVDGGILALDAAPERKWWHSDLRDTPRWNECSAMLKQMRAVCDDANTYGSVSDVLECGYEMQTYAGECTWQQREIKAEKECRATGIKDLTTTPPTIYCSNRGGMP